MYSTISIEYVVVTMSHCGHYVSLCVTVVTMCHYVSLCVTMCHCGHYVSLCVTVVTMCHCVSLAVILSHKHLSDCGGEAVPVQDTKAYGGEQRYSSTHS
jgi:hypothetical protein